MANLTPTEYEEQQDLVYYLELRGLKFTAIPNSTYTKSIKQKQKNYKSGLRAGFPDIIVLIPKEKSKDKQGYMLCIELKRVKGGQLSEHQKEWIEAINSLEIPNVQSMCIKGAKAAIEYVEELLI